MAIFEIIGIILTLVLGIGSIIWGTVSLIIKNSTVAKEEAISELKKVKDDHEYKLKKMDLQIDELDKWRKEMNGHLKLLNTKYEITNSLIVEQKESLKSITSSISFIKTSLAVINESMSNMKQFQAEWVDSLRRLGEKVENIKNE